MVGGTVSIQFKRCPSWYLERPEQLQHDRDGKRYKGIMIQSHEEVADRGGYNTTKHKSGTGGLYSATNRFNDQLLLPLTRLSNRSAMASWSPQPAGLQEVLATLHESTDMNITVQRNITQVCLFSSPFSKILSRSDSSWYRN